MRIRTVKPSFWTNEKMAILPDFTRLLAIGLLNYADDHGYFWANPLMIRGALFPFEEDSSRIRRALSQLEAEGYLKLAKADDGREAGWVVKFLRHQRVDKPQDSEILPLVEFSKNVPRTIQDESTLDRKGRDSIGKDIPSSVGGAIEQIPIPSAKLTCAEEIYAAYPRKVGRKAAITAIAAALRSAPRERLLERTAAYAAATSLWPASERNFIPHPSTWFNRGSYDDDPTQWKRTSTGLRASFA